MFLFRIGNIGTLSVKRTPDGQKTDPYEVTGSSTAGFTKMDLDASSAFFIGGFPTNFEVNLLAHLSYVIVLRLKFYII